VKTRNMFYRVVATVMLLVMLLYGLSGLAGSVRADGPVTFTKHVVDSDFYRPEYCHATDVDRDGDVDILCPADYGNTIAWWENDGAQNFTKHVIDSAFYRAKRVYATDVDGDGDVDVLGAAGTSDEIAWWENDGAQNFTKHIVASAIDAMCVYATDIDDDGDVDILGVDKDGGGIVWWENDGNENFTGHTITDTLNLPWWVYATDMDGDGDVDVLGTDCWGSAVIWWENDGNENFTGHTIDDAFAGPYTVYAVDVDGDGDVDVLAAATGGDEIAWWENDGAQNFTKHTVTNTFDGASSAYAADLDGDGDMDILGTAMYDGTIAWWENDGAENFTKHTVDSAFPATLYAVAIDIDGDDDLDILGSSYDLNDIAWYGNSSLPTLGTIFFTRWDGPDCDIYWIKPDGSTEGLFYESERWDLNARVSPDGTQVVFMHGKEGDPEQSDIYRINLDGTGLQQLTNTPSRVESSPWWSPDGTKIAYIGLYGGGGSGTIWTMSPDGSNQTQIVSGGEAHKTSFGSDGRIYFQSVRLQTGDYDIYRVNSDGSNLERLTTTPDYEESDLMLSPDGTWLVFARRPVSSNLTDIWLMDAGGGNEVQLTNNHGNNRAPIWSPDGTKITFVSDVDGDMEIFIMNADGSGIQQITHNNVSDWTEHWVDVEMGAPSNTPPTAHAGGPYTASEGDTVTLDASGSSDPDANISLYEWDLDNDGEYDDTTGVTIEIDFDDDGIFTVGLRVTDECGQSDTDTAEIIVLNIAPTVDAGAGATINEGDTFSGSGSFTDPGADIWTATVDYGDGSGVQPLTLTGNTFALSHTYAENGDYTVEVCVSDDDEGVGCDGLQVTVNNVAPSVDAGSDANINEGNTFSGSGTFTDPGADTWEATVDYGDGSGSQPLTLTGNTFALSHTYADNGVYTVEVCVTDDDDGVGCDSLPVTVNNVAPSVDAGSDATIDEGGTFSGSGSFADPGADTWAATVGYGDGSGVQPLPLTGNTFALSHTYADNGVHTVEVCVTDEDNGTGCDTLNVTVLNVAPTVGAITAPVDPVQVNTAINTSADFTDQGVLDTHTAEWDWGDDTTSVGTVNETNGSGSVSDSHTYTVAGVYTVKLTVTDRDGGSDQSVFQYVVVYDPEGGFVTGGGWIDSPAGAYTPDPSLTGKATFGFVAKYKKGADTPTGNTEFQFRVANLNFHSDTYQWLVVAGPKAQFKGDGTINGAGNYGFMLTAIDAELTSSTEVDKFRIKIWDKDNSDVIVYDNQMGDADDADAMTAIGGGSIVIHKGK
jgi:Tol biopolymer transport system component/PKD repeat protein